MGAPLDEWARAYLATQVIEVPIVVGWLRGRLPISESLPLAILASTMTHPLLWYLWPKFEPFWLHIGVGEALVWLAEALLFAVWLRRAGVADAWRFGLLVACLANASSMLTGFLLWGR
jgi:hypothetical protein